MGKLIFNAQSTPVAPVGENKHTMFVDSADGKLKMEDSNGCVCVMSDNNDINCICNGINSMSPKSIDVLVIGGGGGGGCNYGGGGNGGTAICTHYSIIKGNYFARIGSGGTSGERSGGDGKPSIFLGIFATGGVGGGYCSCSPGKGTGYSHRGCSNEKQGICTCIRGYLECMGGGGGSRNCLDGCDGSGAGKCTSSAGGPGTCFGGGGGGGGEGNYGCPGGAGYQGVVIISYPVECNYNIEGGTVLCCNGIKSHTFTTDGILCVN